MTAIEVNGISKLYLIGQNRSNSLRDSIIGIVRQRAAATREHWVLKDVSFQLEEGKTLGIIGQNGAGKSTLLKILSRITPPTKGTAVIRGRVGSLLEVGTGFHNELTGRENIYLSGAILGMSRAEINGRFDEIVAFSEIEEFLDTPVKHYSSGMYMRLAFSVAAHLEPEILMVDEVLAVGDIGFQRKCLGKMSEAGRSGRTVLFVSHDMQAISRICHSAIWLKDGRIERTGKAEDVVSEYLHTQSKTGAERIWNVNEMPGNEAVRLMSVRICDEAAQSVYSVDIRRPLVVEIKYKVNVPGKVMTPNFQLYNEAGVCVFVSFDQDPTWKEDPREPGVYTSRATIPGNFLAEGHFFITVVIATYDPPNVHVNETEVVGFHVVDPIEGDSARGNFGGKLHGLVRPVLKWETDLQKNG